ncbi:M20/M25/M40 family metallo-hydrolase [Enterococcus saccharolyticus]|uniref:Peptidase T-like protein n=1 Tax=Enterococcus saccharolyticus subsp. saccharolyticus ATCC 43076 TaxID=1139996 RepID=S0NHQ1_9ENTE|nr:M20/M25/M40 family metallo-hydrolase [Enterococcus saccharolyticus]EOT29238.1 peptidase T-like protein [Enterococcus saccharolyticus subsp. saccharolyticus ATCC 43076]EOT81037.1 peptidase T-like protein [Enterococcus saccharolyticus subsp. saccharolyticus ATCC 43076]OJG86835.1 peptidase T-like protein [Enterococcus saccharolyticus]
MVNKERAISKFLELVQIDSVSYNEREMADYLIHYFTDLGYEVLEDKGSNEKVPLANAGNVIVKLPGKGTLAHQETLILEAHMDTVEPGNGVKPSITADGKYVVSDGSTILGADDKAGIAQILEVEAVLRENNLDHPPLEFLFTIGEEVGILGAFAVDTDLLQGKIAFVLDGGGGPGTAIIGGPDYYDITGKIIGKAAHAGVSPDTGISSIQVMSEAISNMTLLKIDENTTTNIGKVICNYPTNVVPEVTTFAMEVRSLDRESGKRQLNHIIEELEKAVVKFGATLEYDVNQSLFAYHHTDDNPVIKRFKAMCARHDLDYQGIVMRGGTDVSGLTFNGIDAIVLAAGGENGHELQERLIIDEFLQNIQQVIWLVTE